jgi:hypothetical protein
VDAHSAPVNEGQPQSTQPSCPHAPKQHSWAFLSWIMEDSKLRFYEQAVAFALFVRGVSIAINLISATKFVKFLAKKRAAKNKKQNMWERLTRAP